MKGLQRGWWRRGCVLALGVSLPFVACGGSTGSTSGSETHWLNDCERNSECGDLRCRCGVCTLPCEVNADCSEATSRATCANPGEAEWTAVCGDSEAAEAVCLETCERNRDCADGLGCDGGVCRRVDATKAPDGASCNEDDDCESGSCEGEGCEVDGGTCTRYPRACTLDNQEFCGCDGATFSGSGSCPGGRYRHAGACGSLAELGAPCSFDEDCASGLCEGEGCATSAGRCADPDRECDLDAVSYCGCNGQTFVGSSGCPGARFEHVGACEGEFPVPDGCEFLRETEPPPECEADGMGQCEQIQTEDRERRYTLNLRETGGDDEIQERLDCVVTWLEALGLEPTPDSPSVRVYAVFSEIELVLRSAALESYFVSCSTPESANCLECQELDEEQCAEDAFCAPYTGWPVNEGLQCLQEESFMTCVGAWDSFATAGAYQRDEDGACWFTSDYAYELVHFTFDASCTESDPSDSPLPDCE